MAMAARQLDSLQTHHSPTQGSGVPSNKEVDAMERIRVVVIGATDICYEGLRHLLSDVPEVEEVARIKAEAAASDESTSRSDVLVLSTCGFPDEAEALIRRVRAGAPGVRMLLWDAVGRVGAARAFKAGANGYVSSCSAADLRVALHALSKGDSHFDIDALRHALIREETDGLTSYGLTAQDHETSLTPRQREICGLVCHGFTDKEIASRLSISAHTVRTHLRVIFERCDVRRRGELMARYYTTHDAAALAC